MHSLVIFSPMPPLRNGIADYARALLDYHRLRYDCIVVIDDSAPTPCGLPSDVLVMRRLEYHRHAAMLATHRHLFHVGNNDGHIYMLGYLNRVRGTVVLHDPSLHHMLKAAMVGSKTSHERERQAAMRSHGRPGALLAEQAATKRWETMINFLEMNGLGEVLPSAAGAIVHSWAALMKVDQARPGLPCRRIEHFADQPVGDRESRRAAARRSLGLSADETILVSLGFVTNAKQIPQVMEALAIIEKALPRVRYLVVGQEFDLSVMGVARKHGIAHLVEHVDYVPDAKVATYLDAADILVNMRYPTMGETSGSLCRALARGLCAFVSNHGSYAELPNTVVVKIPAAAEIASKLAPQLLAYIKLPRLRRSVEAAASAWAHANLAIAKIADEYHEAIEGFHIAAPPEKIGGPVVCCEADPTVAVLRERIGMLSPDDLALSPARFVGRLWWTEGLVPLPSPNGELLIGGVVTLEGSVARILRVATTREGPSDVGLYVGPWSDISRSGVALADFAARLDSQAFAFFDVWQDVSGDPRLTVDALRETLALHDMDVVAVAGSTTKPLFALGLKEAGCVEVGLLARRWGLGLRPRLA